jgi:hypothetical protein
MLSHGSGWHFPGRIGIALRLIGAARLRPRPRCGSVDYPELPVYASCSAALTWCAPVPDGAAARWPAGLAERLTARTAACRGIALAERAYLSRHAVDGRDHDGRAAASARARKFPPSYKLIDGYALLNRLTFIDKWHVRPCTSVIVEAATSPGQRVMESEARNPRVLLSSPSPSSPAASPRFWPGAPNPLPRCWRRSFSSKPSIS